jgi:hypothetical protein
MAELAARLVLWRHLLHQCDNAAARQIPQRHGQQSTASVEKLVGKQCCSGAKARVLVLRTGLPEF